MNSNYLNQSYYQNIPSSQGNLFLSIKAIIIFIKKNSTKFLKLLFFLCFLVILIFL